MEIVKLKDIPSIMSMFSECICTMESHGIYQWNEHYPTSLIIEEDIKNSCGYGIIEDDCCKAYFAINEQQPMEYEQVTWSSVEGKNLIVHRLSVHPEFQGQGIAGMLMNSIEEYARRNKFSSIRLDVFSVNMIAKRLYSSKGYKFVGEVFFPFREQPFYCMEKILEYLDN